MVLEKYIMSTFNPTIWIFVIEQSIRMNSLLKSVSKSKAVVATQLVNQLINTVIMRNYDGEVPKNRCFISVIGYNHDVKELCSGWLIDENPLRYETAKEKQYNGNGGIIEVEVKQPVWVEPITQDGATNMLGAFKLAKDLCEKWMKDNADGPAPVIINISDGVPYYDGKDPRVCMKETVELVDSIKSLSNNDGNVLIFNAEIGEDSNKVVFPTERGTIQQVEAQFLFDITSEIPDSYKDAARKKELDVKEGSRACIFNAGAVDLIQLIDFGSSKGQGDKGL